jgi:hypothetical protein
MHQASNHSPSPDGTASLLLAALEHAWQTIRQRHPEVPDAVLVVASGSEGKRQGDPGPSADRLRRLPATLRTRRSRRSQQLTLNRQ